MTPSKFHYLVAAHNEGSNVDRACTRLAERFAVEPDLSVVLVENGSTDDTWARCLGAQQLYPSFIRAIRCERAGLGLAFRTGLRELASHPVGARDWIVLAATDLPFGFSDLEAVRARAHEDALVFVGSKAHPQSHVPRDWRRRIGSFVFEFARRLALGLRTKDPQGSIFIRGDVAREFADFRADDYFFSVELIDRAERRGRVIEVPVTLEPEVRASRVRLIRDGGRALVQLWRYRRRRRD